jgi:hypothetical protein
MFFNIILPIVVLALVFGFAWFLERRKAKEKAKKHPLTYNVDIPFDKLLEFPQFTKNGITVRSTVVVPDEALDAIDRGFSHTITNSRHYNPSWDKGGSPTTDAQVFLIPKMVTNVETDPGSPAILVRYLDPNGVDIRTAQSAGTNIGVDGAILGGIADTRWPSVVACSQEDTDWAHIPYLEETIRNEFEHNQEWWNDKGMFFSFGIVGDVHPHFPDWVTGLVSQIKRKCNCLRPVPSTIVVPASDIEGSHLRPGS